LNAAARTARAEFVVQLDQDDAFAPDRLEAIADLARERPDLDVIATDATMELGGKVVARYNRLHAFPVEGQRAEAIRSCFFGWPAIRRERLLAIDGFDEELRVTWDWDCWLRLVLDGCTVGLVDEPLYRWRLAENTLSANEARNARENVVVLRKLLASGAPLSEDERAIAAEMIAAHTQRAMLLEAKAALLGRRPDARRLALAVVTGPGLPPQGRAKALVSLLAPGVARRLLRRQAQAAPTDADLAHR
jgi:hypothetical protein